MILKLVTFCWWYVKCQHILWFSNDESIWFFALNPFPHFEHLNCLRCSSGSNWCTVMRCCLSPVATQPDHAYSYHDCMHDCFSSPVWVVPPKWQDLHAQFSHCIFKGCILTKHCFKRQIKIFMVLTLGKIFHLYDIWKVFHVNQHFKRL